MSRFLSKFVYLIQIVLFFNYCLTLEASKDKKSLNLSKDQRDDRECKYEKGPWQECDPVTGLQKRILKLKAAKSDEANCTPEKTTERACKRQCKYVKGPWSECTNGFKERVDKLRTQVSSTDCKPEKIVNKPCKKQCTYEKSDWTSCENGIKTKTLTLVENSHSPNSPDCEPVKNITKQCSSNKNNNGNSSNNKGNKKNSRRKNVLNKTANTAVKAV